ncbi:hypothetical protein ACZ90_40440 [Streptomyces albus subsp. albus]|nr:hypothetical protein ACZ90_40440 [Streptomyces albus subsp. albus]
MKKSDEEIIEILVAFDATECAHSAARVVGCDPKTVRRYVAARDTGRQVTGPSRRIREIDAFMEDVEEWVDRSEGFISASRAHERLLALGFTGSERTTRRAVAEAKAHRRQGQPRTYRPWIPEPGLWLQYDWAEGPLVPGPDGARRRTALFCAWLPWSRFRVVIPCWDQTLPTLTCCLDSTLRGLGGVPAYLLTRPRRAAGLRHPDLVAVGRHYGAQVRACAPYEPEPTGPVRMSQARISPVDLAPTAVELRGEYPSFTELRAACAEFADQANELPYGRAGGAAGGRPGPRRPHELPGAGSPGGSPRDWLAVERRRLHPLPPTPCIAALGRRTRVSRDGTVAHDGVSYRVGGGRPDSGPLPRGTAARGPAAGSEVWLRVVRGELAVVGDLGGLTEVARHRIGPHPRPDRPAAR